MNDPQRRSSVRDTAGPVKDRADTNPRPPDEPPPEEIPPEAASAETPVRWRELLADAHAALRVVVKGVPVGGWDLPTPCTEWTVGQVLRHTAGNQARFAAAITGGRWPPDDPYAPGHSPPADPLRITTESVALARSAFTTVPDSAIAVPTPLPAGPLPPWIAAGACALDAAIHAWDIAVATRQPSPLTPEIAYALLLISTEFVEQVRPYGAFAAPFDPIEEARALGSAYTGELPDDDASSVLRYLGRNPAWNP
ncbi:MULTISPECIES: TIGR03086 family metal-binding protein [Catenuloplanes]|uniref:Uncharacterized protein (TIGR03086 family) n=1 Tax=Catenuloplanes niger TaxID=587534 RepID=A0AAE3ZT09_9ACTN|nr:TIGR03086 family metal-binding protein [Catenuloplanes niger]MDR7324519.1 uncharacterized protein (TIGR03086 family) [Catenuloplanes niger]